MIHACTPIKDASIYSTVPTMNCGLDEVLEVQKYLTPDLTQPFLIRSLLKFDLNKISAYGTSGSRQFYFRLFETQPENIPLSYTIEINAVSQSWQMGSGKRYNEPITTEGTSWYYKSGFKTSDLWASGSSSVYGGTWYSGSGQQVTASYEYQSADIYTDVTPIVEQWLNNTIENNGFIIKFTDAEEYDSGSYGILKFFSTDTNTIYKPRLEVRYDDSLFVTQSSNFDYTGSLQDNSVVYINSQKQSYKQSSIEKIYISGRDRYPIKTFVISSSQYVDKKILPSASFYAIKDAYTGDDWMPFDSNYTKISYDGTSHYFTVNFLSLPINRLYKFVFKIVRGTLVEYYDNDYIFRIDR